MFESFSPGVAAHGDSTEAIKHLALPVPAFNPPFSDAFSIWVFDSWAAKQTTAIGIMTCARRLERFRAANIGCSCRVNG